MGAKTPKPPDYIGAAQAQGVANVETARATAKLGNPNTFTPYGSQTVSYGQDGDADIPTVTQTLSPENQSLYDQELRISQGLGDIAEGGIGRVDQLLGTEFDNSQVRDRAMSGQEGWDNAYNAQIERNQPFQERSRDRMVNQLSNQGIHRGSEAFQEAMRDLERQENDFNLGAQTNATNQQQAQFGMQSQGRQSDIQQQAFQRQLPLNELMALQSGTQIQSPQFQQFQGSQIAPPPLFQAEGAQYNANLQNANAKNAFTNNLMGGLFGLGSAGMGMFNFGGS